MQQAILDHLQFIYGEARAQEVYPQLAEIIAHYTGLLEHRAAGSSPYFSEKDAVLITYGDMVRAEGERPLLTLHDFLSTTIGESINTVHLLPFFPYSSDDGFSIIDYRQVNPELGDWGDVARFTIDFRLMFDAVVNHISAQSAWFNAFREQQPPFDDYFIVVPANSGLQDVFRPRALPLLTRVETTSGPRNVWTTFSADQIDLNFANPDVLLAVIDTLLFYVQQGADLLRLDAVAYIWKELGTTCIHLPQTHRIIQLMRAVLDRVAPQVILITETNVPHVDNIAYFGDGANEAQMVYNFSLPPLTIHAIHHGSAEILSDWAATLTLPSDRVSFFNFLASHDGIGLTPARGLLADEEVEAIAERVRLLGGNVSYRSNPDGSESPYELNISYIDALGVPGSAESTELIARRFLVAQAIMLALRGVPGIYFHSLFGSRSWHEGVRETGQKRTINRQKLERHALEADLGDPQSLRAQVFFPYRRMLRARSAEPAFHPTGKQEILRVHPSLFALWRTTSSGERRVLCLHNVSGDEVEAAVDLTGEGQSVERFVDFLSGAEHEVADNRLAVTLPAYGVSWLRPFEE